MNKCAGYSLAGSSGVNGDRFYISPDNSVLMLSDGASGAGAEGKVIMSGLCAETVKNTTFSADFASAEEYADVVIRRVNSALTDISREKNRYIFGTLSLCAIRDGAALIAAAGDSPVFLIRGSTVRRIAKPKKTYQGLIDAGLFTEERLEAEIRRLPPHMHSLFDTFIPAVVPSSSAEKIPLKPGDVILLCCDGISDNIDPGRLADFLDGSPEDCAEQLVCAAREASVSARGYCDDMTAVVYQY